MQPNDSETLADIRAFLAEPPMFRGARCIDNPTPDANSNRGIHNNPAPILAWAALRYAAATGALPEDDHPDTVTVAYGVSGDVRTVRLCRPTGAM